MGLAQQALPIFQIVLIYPKLLIKGNENCQNLKSIK